MFVRQNHALATFVPVYYHGQVKIVKLLVIRMTMPGYHSCSRIVTMLKTRAVLRQC